MINCKSLITFILMPLFSCSTLNIEVKSYKGELPPQTRDSINYANKVFSNSWFNRENRKNAYEVFIAKLKIEIKDSLSKDPNKRKNWGIDEESANRIIDAEKNISSISKREKDVTKELNEGRNANNDNAINKALNELEKTKNELEIAQKNLEQAKKELKQVINDKVDDIWNKYSYSFCIDPDKCLIKGLDNVIYHIWMKYDDNTNTTYMAAKDFYESVSKYSGNHCCPK